MRSLLVRRAFRGHRCSEFTRIVPAGGGIVDHDEAGKAMKSPANSTAPRERAIAPSGAPSKPSILHRPLDLALAAFFAVSVLYGFLFSLPEALGVPVAPGSPWPPLRSLYGWAVAQEPAHLDPPPVLIASLLFDGF